MQSAPRDGVLKRLRIEYMQERAQDAYAVFEGDFAGANRKAVCHKFHITKNGTSQSHALSGVTTLEFLGACCVQDALPKARHCVRVASH